MALSIAKEDADHPLSAIADPKPPLPSDLKKILTQSRQQPAPHTQAKLAGMDSGYYDLDLNNDPLQPTGTRVNEFFGVKSDPIPTSDRIVVPPPQLHFNEHHQHYRHRHEAMTIGDMSEPHLHTDSAMEDVKPSHPFKNGMKGHSVMSSTYSESPTMVDPIEFVSQGGIRGKRVAARPVETVIDLTEDTSSQTPTTPSTPAPNVAVNAGNYPSYSASFFRGWFDLPPSLSGQSPMQRPRLSLSMQGTAPTPSVLPTLSSSLPSKTHETVDIPMGPMGPIKRRDEVYGSGHQESFSLGEDEEDAAWGMAPSRNGTEREARRGQMAQ
ncbi:hypothetical protein BGZ81_005080 [Podila clonocystis]|nr:hypothetical protein BGZ81_005080 [Podila clonocystis]